MACDAETEEELAELKADLAAVRAAMRAILSGAQQYSLDTSQTRQVVTRADLGSLRLLRNELRNDIRELETQCAGGASVYVMPGF
jgi:3'-phosphoadenosine 5'-phosphosulfate (PAPS) 3'-phosphatase